MIFWDGIRVLLQFLVTVAALWETHEEALVSKNRLKEMLRMEKEKNQRVEKLRMTCRMES